jgi:hypothetical protein
MILRNREKLNELQESFSVRCKIVGENMEIHGSKSAIDSALPQLQKYVREMQANLMKHEIKDRMGCDILWAIIREDGFKKNYNLVVTRLEEIVQK